MSLDNIAFICYETPFAPCGGVAAVMRYLPVEIAKSTNKPVYVVTPYHYEIPTTNRYLPEMVSAGNISVIYKGKPLSVEIFTLDREVSWIFLRPSNPQGGEIPFFSGTRHPYDVGKYDQEAPAVLRRDAILFGNAAVKSLSKIGEFSSWVVMAQDWEAATICLAQSNTPNNKVSSFITLHNSYDSPVTDFELSGFGIDPEKCPGGTVLDRAIPLAKPPIFTVSKQFAIDLTSEILQSRIMAPHLSNTLMSKLVGVDNGKFTESSLPGGILADAIAGKYQSLTNFKFEKRKSALLALERVQISKDTPVWGDLTKFITDEAPWFVMAGRDDSRQKGYDVCANAVDLYLSDGGNARFLLFPIPGDDGLHGISFLEALASKHPESVIVMPFIFRDGYLSTIQGANFGVMPSLYEPFGMANEFYMNAAMGIGRATGGILQQIIPYREARSFSEAVRIRSNRWFKEEDFPTGLLYREPDGIPSSLTDWKTINEAAGRNNNDWIEQRRKLPLFQSMVDEFVLCISDAVDLYMHKPDQYFKMLAEGHKFIAMNFSWESTAKEYIKHLVKN